MLGGETCFVFFRKTMFRSKDGVQTASLRRKMSKNACSETAKVKRFTIFSVFLFFVAVQDTTRIYDRKTRVFSFFVLTTIYCS